MGFKGLIVTDAMDMQGLTALFSQSEAAVRAIEAGADVLLMPADPEACIRGILEAVRKGRISQRRIDESVTKMLAAKHKVGLYRSRFVNLDKIADRIKDTGLDELAQKVADESVTLVKDDKHLFPIGNPADSCLTVLTEGRYSSRGENLINTVLRRSPGIRAYAANSTTPDAELNGLAEALGQCKQVYIGAFVATAAYRGSVALEGGLGKFLDSLIKGTAPVALISFGSPYLLRSFPGVSAYAATFSISNTSEIAAGKALLGEIPIQGKLPVSIPGFAKIGDGIRVTTRTSRASQGMQ
jgi:beta-N-acetylhexosaminidase